MRKIDPRLKEKLVFATQQIESFLLPVDKISEDEARTIIKRYTAAIEGNFLAWMGAASVSARSVVSRFAAEENLWVELKEDHPSMLRNFAICCRAEPESKDVQYVHDEILNLRKMVGELSGLKNITLMATLENTSIVFIPWLAQLAKKLHCNDLTYTDIHGVADIEHADQFLEALTDEQNLGYAHAEEDIDEVIDQAINLFRKCFVI